MSNRPWVSIDDVLSDGSFMEVELCIGDRVRTREWWPDEHGVRADNPNLRAGCFVDHVGVVTALFSNPIDNPVDNRHGQQRWYVQLVDDRGFVHETELVRVVEVLDENVLTLA